MKVLYVNGCFLLPDDFNGTEVDAIKLLAERYYKAYSEQLQKSPEERQLQERIPDKTWKEFLEVVERGYRVHMEIFCGELIDDKWIDFNPV